jgi:quercetin dioxygenase-like cupin family protein
MAGTELPYPPTWFIPKNNIMLIKEILKELETSKHPIAKAFHKGTHFRVLVMAFKKGMTLKDHQAHLPSRFVVMEGKVIYIENDKRIELSKFEEVDIPIHVTHSVQAIEDSLCLLTQG